MLVLVTGGSGSGKSLFAENKIVDFGDFKRVYIATMEVHDDESRQRIKRHQKMRADKNFRTVESPTHLEDVKVSSNENVLLECMSNLVANEMFSQSGRPDNVVDIICEGIKKINRESKHMVVVTNEVFCDGVDYDEITIDYIRKLGEINCRLGSMADEVYEVVAAVPVRYK